MVKLWEINLNNYDWKNNRKYETIFTLANGYRGFRGIQDFSKRYECGNFIAGIFDKNDAQVTEIVNCQNPLLLNIYFDNELVDIDTSEVINFERKLNMKEGVLYSTYSLKLPSGRMVKIDKERFVSRNNVHRYGEKIKIKPLNFSGKMFVENLIDGSVTNSTYDPYNRSKHIRVEKALDLKPGILLSTKTIDKGIEIVEATTIYAECEGENIFKSRKFSNFGEVSREVYEAFVKEGKEFVLFKYGTTFTSRDSNLDLINLTKVELDEFLKQGYEDEKQKHINVWEELWNKIDIQINGDEAAQIGIRFNLFQLASSAYEGDTRVSIAAKALHGEGYKGHVFWDTETFMLPFFIYTNPKVARALLMYRYNTLDGARKNAKMNGYKGAQFPWESADDGLEVTPKWGFGYNGEPIRIWTGEEEFHINADISFAVWEYYRATGDEDFWLNYGIEIILDTAKFWNSRLEYNKEYDRYEINKVIGPDEFHEHVNNNVFTNYLAKWNMKKAVEVAKQLNQINLNKYRALCNNLCLSEIDFNEWENRLNKIYIPMAKDGKLIEQFEGYFELADIPITKYDSNGMPKWPDLKGLKLHDTQLIKQADIVMLMLMLEDEFSDEVKKINYEYYEKRTMHKSSLSPSMYSIMGLKVGDRQNSYKYFMKTIYTDIEDNQGNAAHGLHAASTGGSWQSAVFGFGGFSIDNEEIPNFNPWIPENWNEFSYKLNWKGTELRITIDKEKVGVRADNDILVKIYGNKFNLVKDEEIFVSR
ncbi:Kojibiose phosphorylase [Caloramator mitchellensis]|uniref:Kojibiose phosphorylase n=1 Tax=Caloramator mitchellensis TaxID=908809 RepID=A0A0R3K626_CALMK|nr:glycosyl hydrolase family 65 protein [Caloramator mitchellensis]KRQ87855.1 Kojibiose phosphorylase [Caloramator mitchellensis]